jgi:hypothetical protein
VYKIKDYGNKYEFLGYIGKGYYGSTSEQAMMKEI